MAAKFSGVSKAPSQRTASPGRDRFSPRRGKMSPQVTKRGTDVTADDKKGNLAKPSGFDGRSLHIKKHRILSGGKMRCSVLIRYFTVW